VLAIDATRDLAYHVDLGARLAPLRERGVLIAGSGNVVHNLRRVDWAQPDVGFDWAQRFDEAARQVLADDPSALPRLAEHPDLRAAVPTPDHFIPVLDLAGLAAAAGRPTATLIDGYALGSLSMTCHTLDADCPTAAADDGGAPAAGLPDPAVTPPEGTNT
jgi:4,5-DOPA dioxygenase extradiol